MRAVKGAGLNFFEQPTTADDLAGMAAIAAVDASIAIGADEGIHSLDDIQRHHDRNAARGVSLKAIKLGGIKGGGRGRTAVRPALGMSVNVSCKTGESSIACAAALHVAAVIPNIDWALTLTHTALGEDVTAQRSAPRRAMSRASIAPDWASTSTKIASRRHRVRIAARNVA